MDKEELRIIERAAGTIDSINEKIDEGKSKPTVDLGVCEQCMYCSGYERDLGFVYYRCDVFDRAIDFKKPRIVRCRSFSKRGMLSINQMFDIAYFIEKDKKTIIGFCPEQD